MSRGEREINGDVQETVGECGRSLSQTSYFWEDRRCRRSPTDTSVKNERSKRYCICFNHEAGAPVVSACETHPQSSPSSTATPSKFSTTIELNAFGSAGTTDREFQRPGMLLIPRAKVDAELCPNEKMVDVRRCFDGHGNSFQSHPIMWAHPDHFHCDPGRVNPSHDRQPDVDKGLLVFQP
jgi:hypothetical protein